MHGKARQGAHSETIRAAAPAPRPPRDARPRTQDAAFGNQARLRGLQARLEVGPVDHPLEREADAAADTVMRMPDAALAQPPAVSPADPRLNRKCAACEEEEKPVQRKTAGTDGSGQEAPPLTGQVLATPGAPLDAAARAFFEPRFGRDFSDVRVHTDRAAAQSAQALRARAYTVGADLVFAEGQYAPANDAGRHLLAHELAHTIQQAGGSATIQRDGPDVPLKGAKKEDATDALTGGLKTVADKAGDNEPLKTFGLDLAKQYALPIWSNASDADKAAMVVGGAAIYGTGVGALASNRIGRDKLSGVNFIAPLGLVPYATLTGFSFDTPKAKTDPFAVHLSFKGDDLLDLAHRKLSYVPPLTLSFDMTLSVAPDGKVTTPFAMAKFGVLPGVTVAAGFGVASDLPKLESGGPDKPLAPLAQFPQPAQPAPPAGSAVFVSVDLLKAPILPKAVRSALGGDGK
jgi:hypothetical protein